MASQIFTNINSLVDTRTNPGFVRGAIGILKKNATAGKSVAATINGASATEIEKEFKRFWLEKKANLIFIQAVPSFAFIPYSFGKDLIEKVKINGSFI